MRTLIFCPCKMKLFFLLVAFAGLVLATSPQQLEFLNAITRGDIQKVAEMMRVGSFEAQGNDEQARKRRRLDPIDPSFSECSAVFTAISAKQREILDLLLADERVQNTISHFDLTMKCIETGFNHIVKRYLRSSERDDCTPYFSHAIQHRNIEILELLVSDSRVSLKDAVTMSLLSHGENLDPLFNFFLGNRHVNQDYSNFLLLQLACTSRSMRNLLQLFSRDEFIPHEDHMRELLDHGKYEIPIIVMSRSPLDLNIFGRVIGRPVARFMTPMKWFNECTLEQFIRSKDRIEGYSPEIQNAFLAQASLQDQPEKLKFLLSLGIQLNQEMVTLLVASAAFDEIMELFEILISDSAVLGCLDQANLNSLTEHFILHRNSFGQKCIFNALIRIPGPFSTMHFQLMNLEGPVTELEKKLGELSKVVEGLQKEGLKGLAAIASLALAHHTAMVTIYSQGIFLPFEICAHILEQNLNSLNIK